MVKIGKKLVNVVFDCPLIRSIFGIAAAEVSYPSPPWAGVSSTNIRPRLVRIKVFFPHKKYFSKSAIDHPNDKLYKNLSGSMY